MKKEMSRDDERKLYEAYEVLDRWCNGKSTVDIIVTERWHKIYEEIDRLFDDAIKNAFGCQTYYKFSDVRYYTRKALKELFTKLQLKGGKENENN